MNTDLQFLGGFKLCYVSRYLKNTSQQNTDTANLSSDLPSYKKEPNSPPCHFTTLWGNPVWSREAHPPIWCGVGGVLRFSSPLTLCADSLTSCSAPDPGSRRSASSSRTASPPTPRKPSRRHVRSKGTMSTSLLSVRDKHWAYRQRDKNTYIRE